jgi:nudix-type nucleoside diphosphatase (YffH/AdpP family)
LTGVVWHSTFCSEHFAYEHFWTIKHLRHELIATETIYEGFAKLLRARFRVGKEEIAREVEDHGDAVAVLPYDPERRVALFVSLSRAPVIVSGTLDQFIEAPAGLLEDEQPAETAKRELLEEAGLRVTELDHVGHVWSSPGISTERMHLFLARYSRADRTGEGGGLAEEHEDITVSEVALRELGRKLDQGEIADMKTLALLLLLRARQPELFV